MVMVMMAALTAVGVLQTLEMLQDDYNASTRAERNMGFHTVRPVRRMAHGPYARVAIPAVDAIPAAIPVAASVAGAAVAGPA
jgi:hypothetical protein